MFQTNVTTATGPALTAKSAQRVEERVDEKSRDQVNTIKPLAGRAGARGEAEGSTMGG